MATLLYLLNSPESRLYMRSDVGLEVCLFGCFIFYCLCHFHFHYYLNNNQGCQKVLKLTAELSK